MGWQQGEDKQWNDQGQIDKKQVWQGCEQGGVCPGREKLGDKPAEEVGRCCQAGAEGATDLWLLRCEWQDCAGEGAVCQGEEHPRQLTCERKQLGRGFVVVLQVRRECDSFVCTYRTGMK